MQPRTIRFPGPLDDQLRKRSFETRVPINTIVLQAVHMLLNASGGEKLAKWFETHPVPADPDEEENSDGPRGAVTGPGGK